MTSKTKIWWTNNLGCNTIREAINLFGTCREPNYLLISWSKMLITDFKKFSVRQSRHFRVNMEISKYAKTFLKVEISLLLGKVPLTQEWDRFKLRMMDLIPRYNLD